jgi:hypothetical protein
MCSEPIRLWTYLIVGVLYDHHLIYKDPTRNTTSIASESIIFLPHCATQPMANGFTVTTSNYPSRTYSEPSPRKLPSPPVQRTDSVQVKRGSRPLPKIPPSRSLICKKCATCITSHNVLFPSSSVSLSSIVTTVFSPLNFSCRATRELSEASVARLPFLQKCEYSVLGFQRFQWTLLSRYNVISAPANVQLMTTGAHTMQELSCAVCSSYVGWKIVRAHDHSESWKDGNFLLELEQLYLQPDIIISGDLSSHPQPLFSSSDSEYSP